MRTVVVAAGYGPNDPPTQNTCRYFTEQGWRVILVAPVSNTPSYATISHAEKVYHVAAAPKLGRFAPVYEFLCWGRALRRAVIETKAKLMISFMFHPWVSAGTLGGIQRVACIYDIPASRYAGVYSRYIIRRGWRDIKKLDLVWSSDPLKARLCEVRGHLSVLPQVCYNVPYSDYIKDSESGSGRAWLCERLSAQGVRVEQRQKILLRAGAFGVYGGIEETLNALVHNPEWVFVLMGKPDSTYEVFVRGKVEQLNLQNRVSFLVRPSNDDWRRALLGADAGHLLHLRSDYGYHQEMFDNNSPLSTNRLFQYMAAELPTISSDDSRMARIHAEVNCFVVAESADLEHSLNRILTHLYTKDMLKETMGKVARKAHLSKYNWSQQFGPIFKAISSHNE